MTYSNKFKPNQNGDEFIPLEKFLGKAKSRLARVGIELEGGWTTLPKGCSGLTHDGSVKIEDKEDKEFLKIQNDYLVLARELQNHLMSSVEHKKINEQLKSMVAKLNSINKIKLKTGEMVSPILEEGKFPSWVKENYPSHVNNTCGLHVHMSFNNARHYSNLMIPQYQFTIAHYLEQWAKKEGFLANHPIWARLQGKNEFCKLEFFPDLQATKINKDYHHTGEGNRYTAISYRYGEHGTIECRLLPMFPDAEQSIRAIQTIFDITNACLLSLNKKEEKLKMDLVINGEMMKLREDNREFV